MKLRNLGKISATFFSLILFVGLLFCDAQNLRGIKKTEQLDSLIKLFKVDINSGIKYQYLKSSYKNRIPPYFAKKYLAKEPTSNKEHGFYAGKILINNNNFYALAYDKPCYKKNLCRVRYLSILDKKGNNIANMIFGYDSSTKYTLDTMRSEIIQQSLIEKIYKHYTFSIKGYSKIVKSQETDYVYFQLSDSGALDRIEGLTKSRNRKFPFTSKRLVQPKELDELTTRELDIMQNEIFADHGYRFQIERWKEYFGKKDWYNPKYDKVVNKLNPIELHNIKRIVRFQRNDKNEGY